MQRDKPMWNRNPKKGTLANSEEPDEMPHYAVFHRLLRQKQSSEKKIKYYLKIFTCDLSIYTMNHPDFTIKLYGKFHRS